MTEHLGPALHSKAIDLVFIVDVSGSMASDAKIQSLNAALEEALPFLREAAAEAVGVEPKARVLTFGSTARWAVERVDLDDFWWPDLRAEPQGLTELGAAIGLLEVVLTGEQHQLPPAVVLLTDGMPTNTIEPTFEEALARLDAHPIGRATQRVGVAIGSDASEETLHSFVAATRGEVMDARRPDQLTGVIRLAGTSVLRSASQPTW